MTGKTITRRNLADAIREEIGFTHADSAELVDEVLELVIDALANGERVKIANFGVFIPHSKRERMGRNPKTGEEVPILPRRVIRFRPSEKLRQMMNHTENTLQYP